MTPEVSQLHKPREGRVPQPWPDEMNWLYLFTSNSVLFWEHDFTKSRGREKNQSYVGLEDLSIGGQQNIFDQSVGIFLVRKKKRAGPIKLVYTLPCVHKACCSVSIAAPTSNTYTLTSSIQ